jgi:hypothetical protein
MSKINFEVCGADISYELHDLNHNELLIINDEVIIDAWGDIGGWGDDYQLSVCGLHGAAKKSATTRYLRERAERLIIAEIFSLRAQLKDAYAE